MSLFTLKKEEVFTEYILILTSLKKKIKKNEHQVRAMHNVNYMNFSCCRKPCNQCSHIYHYQHSVASMYNYLSKEMKLDVCITNTCSHFKYTHTYKFKKTFI